MSSDERREAIEMIVIWFTAQFAFGFCMYKHNIVAGIIAMVIGLAYSMYYMRQKPPDSKPPLPPTTYWGGPRNGY